MSDTEHSDRGTAGKRPFVFFHIGDLHLTAPPLPDSPTLRARQERIVADLDAMLADIASLDEHSYDFVYLPGDLAENGLPGEYSLLAAALARQPHVPIRFVPGDHDRALGNVDAFTAFRAGLTAHQKQGDPKHNQRVLRALTGDPPAPDFERITQFFHREKHQGVTCLFVDMVTAGYGRKGVGLDFRLGEDQFAWLEEKCLKAMQRGKPCVVFQHCYPADMRDPDDAAANLAGLYWSTGVCLVEMGHTHYNELAPDGRTLYATARSVGQNEDGPVGFAVAAVDGAAVSWRFKPLQQTWPFVLITSPADRRLATAAPEVDDGRLTVRASVFSDDRYLHHACQCRVDDGPWTDMWPVGASFHEGSVAWVPGARRVSVRARGNLWHFGSDLVDVDTIEPAGLDFRPATSPKKPGSDEQASKEPWPNHGIRGDQLGPNKQGRKW